MNELVVPGIVASAEDYKENDKLIKVITAGGLITIRAKGVKKDKAKLKFAAMPFSFCEFSIVKSQAASYYVLTNAVVIESMMGVISSNEKYLASSVALECARIACPSGGPDIFINLLESLKRIIYSGVDPFSIAVNYVYFVMRKGGYVSVTQEDGKYNMSVSSQKTIEPEGEGRKALKRNIIRFEKYFEVKLKSGELV